MLYPISLGCCYCTSYYLQDLNLRKSFFPFDWSYTTIQMVIDIIEDDFNDFLNRDYIDGHSHSLYHNHLFVQDTSIQENYDYYVRCVETFRKVVNSRQPKLFFYTSFGYKAEQEGFAERYKLNKLENTNDLNMLYDFLENRYSNFGLEVIIQKPNGKPPKSSTTKIKDNFHTHLLSLKRKMSLKRFEHQIDIDHYTDIEYAAIQDANLEQIEEEKEERVEEYRPIIIRKNTTPRLFI